MMAKWSLVRWGCSDHVGVGLRRAEQKVRSSLPAWRCVGQLVSLRRTIWPESSKDAWREWPAALVGPEEPSHG